MVTSGPKHVASHTIKYDMFDVRCFIILILNLNTSGCLQSKSENRLVRVYYGPTQQLKYDKLTPHIYLIISFYENKTLTLNIPSLGGQRLYQPGVLRGPHGFFCNFSTV